jgi:hypothetical protein
MAQWRGVDTGTAAQAEALILTHKVMSSEDDSR